MTDELVIGLVLGQMIEFVAIYFLFRWISFVSKRTRELHEQDMGLLKVIKNSHEIQKNLFLRIREREEQAN